jgi:deoxyribodipyrimidine photolyase-related protein
MTKAAPRGRLAVVLGDQLDDGHPALAGLDPARDTVLLVEAPEEARHVWSHKARIALFSRRCATSRSSCSAPITASTTCGSATHPTLRSGAPGAHHRGSRPPEVRRAASRASTGCWRCCSAVARRPASRSTCCPIRTSSAPPIRIRPPGHGTPEALLMELFYREMRKRHGVLMERRQTRRRRLELRQGEPRGLRRPARADPARAAFAARPDHARGDREVELRFPGHPGSLDRFDWPVTRARRSPRWKTSSRTAWSISAVPGRDVDRRRRSAGTRSSPRR